MLTGKQIIEACKDNPYFIAEQIVLGFGWYDKFNATLSKEGITVIYGKTVHYDTELYVYEWGKEIKYVARMKDGSGRWAELPIREGYNE